MQDRYDVNPISYLPDFLVCLDCGCPVERGMLGPHAEFHELVQRTAQIVVNEFGNKEQVSRG